MRVLHVDTSTGFRGGQQQLAWLLRARRDPWAGVPDGLLAALVGPPDIPLRPGGDPRNALALVGVTADVFAAHTPHAHGICLLAGKRTVVHRRVDFVPRDPWKYRPVAGVIAVSAAVRSVLIGVGLPAERIEVVYDGVEAAEDGPAPEDLPRPLYVCVGALVDHKGHRYAVDAMGSLRGTLLIAGEGPNRAALQKRIANRGLVGRVRLLGQVPEIGGLLASADAFVHPSTEEGLGQVVLEAMLAGCRVVATAAGGIPEIVGACGELVRPRDVDALTAAMHRVLSRPRGEGIARAQQFSVARMVAGTAEAYGRFLGSAVANPG